VRSFDLSECAEGLAHIKYARHGAPVATTANRLLLEGADCHAFGFGEVGMVADTKKVETRLIGEAGVPEHLAHLVDAGLKPDAEEDLLMRSHQPIQPGPKGMADASAGAGGLFARC
jgi:hypothetical protein